MSGGETTPSNNNTTTTSTRQSSAAPDGGASANCKIILLIITTVVIIGGGIGAGVYFAVSAILTKVGEGGVVSGEKLNATDSAQNITQPPGWPGES